MPISALPPAPVIGDQAIFSAQAANFLGAMPTLATEMNNEIARINSISSGSFSATSTTSLTIATGSKTLTVETGKGFAIGQPVMIASTANPTNYMTGQVTSYTPSTGSLVVNATQVNGSGTLADWAVSLISVVRGGGVSPDALVVLTSGTSWTNSGDWKKARLRVVGGGGGGHKSNNANVIGPSGGSGGTVEVFVSLASGASYTYVIGAGGGAGSAGGTTSITISGVTYSATGGGGSAGYMGIGGTGSGAGALVLDGQSGFAGIAGRGAVSAVGGVYGLGGMGSSTSPASPGLAGVIILELYK